MGAQTSKRVAPKDMDIVPITRPLPRVGVDVVVISSDDDDSDDDVVIMITDDEGPEDEPEDPVVGAAEAAIRLLRNTQLQRIPQPGATRVGVEGNWEIRGNMLVGEISRVQAFSGIIMMLYVDLQDSALPFLQIELLDEFEDVEYTEDNIGSEALRQFLREDPGLKARVYLDLGSYFWVNYSSDPPGSLEEYHDAFGHGVWNIMEKITTTLTPNQDELFFHGNLSDAIFFDYETLDVRLNIFAANSDLNLGVDADMEALTDLYLWLYVSRKLLPEYREPAPGQMEEASNLNAFNNGLQRHLTMARQAARMRAMLTVIEFGGIPDPDEYAFVVNTVWLGDMGFPEPMMSTLYKPRFTVDDLAPLTTLGRKERVLQRCFGSWRG